MMRQCRKIVGESSRSDTNNAKKDPEKVFFTRLSLGKVVALHELLTEEQKIAVESIGFGSILNLQCDTMRQSLCTWIVRNFDVLSMSMVIHGKKLKVNCDDVEQILGLPNQGTSVPTDGPDDELIEELCRTFSVTELIPLDLLGNKLEKCKTHGDEFKRMYCIYILGYLFCPSSEKGVKKGMLHAIKDVSKINTYNWAQFVLDTLSNGIKQSLASNRKSVRGCLFILMIFFLEHVNPGKNLPPEHNMSPSICYWSNDKVLEKLGKFKARGGYKSPSACFVSEKRVVHEAGESVDLECVESQTRLSKIEKCVCELKSGMQDVKNDVNDIKMEFNKDFCEMKNLLHLILNSQTGKQSDGNGKIEENDHCGPTAGDEHESLDIIGDRGTFDGVEITGFGDGIIVETGDQCGPTANDEDESVEKNDGLTGNGGKRVLDDEQNVSDQSLVCSNKRLRIAGEFTEIASTERYIQPQSEKEEMLQNEVKKLESEINELQKSKLEEIEKRDEEIIRLERELSLQENLVQSYREAFEELHKGLNEGPSYDTPNDANIETLCVKHEKDR